jgi:meiotic recombination protein REC8
MEIDPEAGRARSELCTSYTIHSTNLVHRPDQLNLQDDPAFLPDFDINLDLSLFDLPPERSLSRGSSQLPSLAGSSRVSLSDHEPQLELPSDETPVSGIGGFDLGVGTSSVGHYGSNLRAQSMFEEPGIINDPEFDIDADGNFYTPARGQSQSEIVQAAPASLGFPGNKAVDSTGITERVRAEHEAGLQGPVDDPPFDLEDQGIYMGDDEPQLPDVAQFSSRHASSAHPEQHLQTSSAHPEQEVSSVSEAAPQRRIRTKPAIKVDHETQLPSSLLKSWETDYLQKMAADWKRHEHFTSTLPQSKKNAEHIVLNIGLSGLGREFDTDLDHPLRQAFGGQALFDLLLGKESSPVGKKRGHASDEDNEDDEEGRRVRPRSDDEPELGRGEDGQFQFDDGDGIFAQGNDDPVSFLLSPCCV